MADRFSRHLPAPPQKPLTKAQERTLVALVDVCRDLGAECDPASIARAASLRTGGVTLALQGLERRKLAAGHGQEPRLWSPTLTGRALARSLGGGDEPRFETPDR